MSCPYYGDFPVNHTSLCMVFDAFALATGAPTAITNFVAGDVQIYKDLSAVQRSSSAGIGVTAAFDSVTGWGAFTVDLSDNTDPGFYAAGHEYQVGINVVTIDTQSMTFWCGTFSIERAGGVLSLIKGNAIKVDVNTIKTNGVVNAGTVTFPTNATLPSTTSVMSADAIKMNGTTIKGTGTAADLWRG